eukprot:CAMPEP_0184856596 /NCGR_PEP_ID=MMETSP0580-20130426/1776_1 /TAXON_ID=1118495 /ORGANISM="Dactyliosolen fragilissimus" /LENGTH=200 /DNA_ID=CAMNT_0027351699 /DNA_START=441 /DNA_END=1039 /DNA_ORIENTATION=+
MKDVIELMASLFQDKTEREHKIKNEFFNRLIGKEGCSDDIEEFVGAEDKQNRFGVLQSFGVPINKTILSLLLREITMLAQEYPKLGINTFENWKGNDQVVVVIPQCKNEATFERMNQKTRWLDDIPMQIVGNSDKMPLDAAKWMIQQLGSKHPSSFKEAAADLGFCIDGKVMDQATANAMWEKANINSSGQRIITRYLKG